MDNPAAPDTADELDSANEAAQLREDDPDGDPTAADGGAAEEPSEVDPAPQLNDDADDDFADLADEDA